ncbi:MAG: nickel-dependent lactate racemase [Spirochaetaceae bacterium]|nr:nickel-dependent lactate racemase [Spirochaetaceae bacterium]
MELEIGFGTTPQRVTIPDSNLAGVLLPNRVEVTLKGEAAVRDALAHPIGSPRLGELVKPGEKIVLITSDITRPFPSHRALPAALEELEGAGVSLGDVTLVFALGSHRKHTPDEMKKLVGEAVFAKVRCVDSDRDDFVRMGRTALGTPVDITRVVAQADKRVGLGNIEFHYFAGYSGGAKAIMPGVSTREAIQVNHSRMTLPEAVAGRLGGNPVREDIEEALSFCPLHFILNAVLDEHKEIIFAAAGHPVEAHRAGCAFLDRLYKVEIPEKADIVLVSQGGAPKDLNLYQTQKALDNAKHAVKDGGIIILVGACGEGLGEAVFQEWMTTATSPRSLVERIRRDFQLGGHKAAAIALVLERAEIYLVSQMEEALVERLFMRPFGSVQSALDGAMEKMGNNARILVMPYGGSTLPALKQ